MQFVLHVRNHRIEVQRDDSLTDMFNMRIIPHYLVEQRAFLSTRILIVYLKKMKCLELVRLDVIMKFIQTHLDILMKWYC